MCPKQLRPQTLSKSIQWCIDQGISQNAGVSRPFLFLPMSIAIALRLLRGLFAHVHRRLWPARVSSHGEAEETLQIGHGAGRWSMRAGDRR